MAQRLQDHMAVMSANGELVVEECPARIVGQAQGDEHRSTWCFTFLEDGMSHCNHADVDVGGAQYRTWRLLRACLVMESDNYCLRKHQHLFRVGRSKLRQIAVATGETSLACNHYFWIEILGVPCTRAGRRVGLVACGWDVVATLCARRAGLIGTVLMMFSFLEASSESQHRAKMFLSGLFWSEAIDIDESIR
jgi:hypothetical protein